MAKLQTPMRLDKDNISFNVLLTKDELLPEASLWQAGYTAANSSTWSILSKELEDANDNDLGKENAHLKTQLLEVVADNEALSKSLQERAKSLADMTDAKFQAEGEAKVLQVQIKVMQKDMDAHKYELHFLRKQLQIKNDESEHNKRASDASHKQHLDNVKKIARLESECQRLRSLIRQRLPGPAAIAQMRAETEFHIKKQKVSSPYGHTSRSLPKMKSSEQYEIQIQALTDRLSSIEDEANFLKEALVKKTAELQEARQLCARTAMKLSSAQNNLEAMSMQPLDNDKSMKIRTSNSVYEGGNPLSNAEEDREVICAESWASALVAELSNLSRAHGSDQYFKRLHDASQADNEELDLQSAFEEVRQKLSSVGSSLAVACLQPTGKNADEDMRSFYPQNCVNARVNFDDILEEVSQVKQLLLELGRGLELQDRESRSEPASPGSTTSLTTQNDDKSDGISMISVTDNVGCGTLIDSSAENRSLVGMALDMVSDQLVDAYEEEDAITDHHKEAQYVDELEQMLQTAQAEVEASRGRIADLDAHLHRSTDALSNTLSATCTLNDNLKADLAKAQADLDLEVSSTKSELAVVPPDECQHYHSASHTPTKNLSGGGTDTHVCGQCISTKWNSFCIAKEGEEIAAARAQLAYCQRCIGMLREHLKLDVQSQLQDVIKDELASLEMTSSSSNSIDEKSTSSSPTTLNDTNFGSLSFKHPIDLQPMEHNLLNIQPAKYNLECLEGNSCDFSHDSRFVPSSTIPTNHTQSHEETKQYSLSIVPTPKGITIESMDKDNVPTPAISWTKHNKLAEFFSKARLNGGN